MSSEKLNRTLGLTSCVFFGVGSILGAGIYALIGKVAGHAGNMTWLAFMIASVVALLSSFSYAELSAAFPKAGGEYVYVREAMGKRWGFLLGALISLNGAISGATVSLGFGGYFAAMTGVPLLAAALGILLAIFIVNISGIRESSTINIIFTVIEAAGLLLVIGCAWPSVGSVSLFEMPPGGTNSIFIAAALSFYAFIGFEEIVKLAEETKDPEKNIPRALFIAGGIVVMVYLVVCVVAVNALPAETLGRSARPLADIVAGRMGETGVLIISVIALFATGNTILSNMVGSSRVLFGMAQDERRIAWLSTVLSGRKTPAAALLAVAGVMMGFALIGKIEVVALIANFSILLTFLMVNLSVIILRRKAPHLKRPMRIPGAVGGVPVITVLATVLTVFLLVFTVIGLVQV